MLRRIIKISFHVLLLGSLLATAVGYDIYYKARNEDNRLKKASGVTETFRNVCVENNDKGPLQITGLDGAAAAAIREVASNEKFSLVYDEKTSAITIENKNTGEQWSSIPKLAEGSTAAQQALVQKQVQIRYSSGSEAVLSDLVKEVGTLTPTLVDGGLKVSYEVKSLGISFALEYRLSTEGLEVNIPEASIKEWAKCKLVSIEPMPYFDAGSSDEEGYIVIPDGSGALIEFQKKHLQYFDRYYQSVYGVDPAFASNIKASVMQEEYEDIYPYAKEKVALPIVGIHRENQGFLAIITAGDHDANIIASPSGFQNVPLYRASVEFKYRSSDMIFIGDSGIIPVLQGARLIGDRTVRYVLLEGEESEYVGMAGVYRNYLMNEQGVKEVVQEESPLRIHLVGGVMRDEIIGSSYLAMTTFKQAREIIDRFSAAGVQQLELVIEGWSDGGVFGKQPVQFPVAKGLGGTTELKKLIEYAQSKHVQLYLDANYVKPFIPSGSYNASKEAIHGMTRQPVKFYEQDPATMQVKEGTSFHLLNPDKAVNKYLKAELNQFKKLKVDGLHLSYMGEELYSDLRKSSPIYRKDTIASWREAMEAVRTKVGQVSVDYGLAYTFGYVDRIVNAPMDSSHFIYEGSTIPFYQIALRGLVPYYGEAGNLGVNPQNEMLRMLEYGALPYYQLTYKNSSNLQRTPLEGLLSSDVHDWLEPAAELYNQAEVVLNQVAGKAIINHEQLEKGLYRTTFENGVSIFVNYGTEAKTVESTRIEAGSFAWSGKGE